MGRVAKRRSVRSLGAREVAHASCGTCSVLTRLLAISAGHHPRQQPSLFSFIVTRVGF